MCASRFRALRAVAVIAMTVAVGWVCGATSMHAGWFLGGLELAIPVGVAATIAVAADNRRGSSCGRLRLRRGADPRTQRPS